jgi:hypothetical protein
MDLRSRLVDGIRECAFEAYIRIDPVLHVCLLVFRFRSSSLERFFSAADQVEVFRDLGRVEAKSLILVDVPPEQTLAALVQAELDDAFVDDVSLVCQTSVN